MPSSIGTEVQNDPSAASTVDITRHRCPMTFVHTRLALDRIQSGQVLAVLLVGEEPLRNVPQTAVDQGHQILSTTTQDDGVTRLLIRKG